MMQKAIFAAGCFWGVETALRRMPGVVTTRVGYTGGTLKDPSYEEVCSDATGHAEAVEVTFDPAQVSYEELLNAFWSCHDPTTRNRQGPDVGTQYRSAIFCLDQAQKQAAQASLQEITEAKLFPEKVVTEITQAGPFYPAEAYHQQYFARQGHEGSCHFGSVKVHTKLAEAAAARRRALTAQPGG